MDVDPGAKVEPGESIGTLTTDSVGFVSSSSELGIEFDLTDLTSDLLDVHGTVGLNNSTLNLAFYNPVALMSPVTFLIVANDSGDPVNGVFGFVTGLPPALVASINYQFVGGDVQGRVGDGNDIAITVAHTAVPEPGTLVVWGLMLLSTVGGARACRRLAIIES